MSPTREAAGALGPGGEFDLIRRFLADGVERPGGVTVGPGDDAAVLEGGWVVSCDLSIEDVHFRRAWISDRDAGFRATAAALSDLAAMAAEPVGILLSLAAPLGGADLESVHAGARDAALAVGAGVLGGDTSTSPGPLVIDVVVIGRAVDPVLRAGAGPGDEIWVTGALGGAAAAVRVWRGGGEPAAPLEEAFARPLPRVREALWLRERAHPTALIDLSDGLAGDAGHVAAASGVRLSLDAAAVPVSEPAAAALGPEAARALALGGGEDYELLLTARPDTVDPEAFTAAFGLPLARVGRVEEGEGVALREADGRLTELRGGGYDHFEGPAR